MAIKNKQNKANAYRFIVIDNETLEKRRSFILTKPEIYGWIGVIFGFIFILSWLIFVYTPIGPSLYSSLGSTTQSQDLIALSKNVGELENTVNAQNSYIQSVQRLITYHEGSDQTEFAPIVDSLKNFNQEGFYEILSSDIELSEKENLSSVSDEGPSFKSVEELYFVPPIKGQISASFLEEKKHLGTDILAPAKTPVKCILNGYVIMSDWTIDTGYSIGIQHGHGLVSFYKHNSALLKETGDFVTTGEVIAIIGNTGELTTGPHLHFELWREGKPINPSAYISFE